MTTIDAAALAADFKGELIAPDHHGYEPARQIWNGHIQRRPGLIASCQGAADVMAAVRFARDRDLPVSVRGGGHGVAGMSVLDDGVVIDLSPMTGSRVDPLARTISLQGGAHNAHMDRESQAFGLAATSGYVSHTGIAGLTLGGGIGHTMRKLGLSIDALRSVDLVTADGEFVVANEQENADLFWGLRGGGGNFGVATNLTFDLQPLGPSILAGMVVWSADQLPQVLTFLRDFLAEAPDDLGLLGNLRLAPALPAFPEALHGKPIIAIVVTWMGDHDEGDRVLRPLRSFGSPVLDTVTAKPYVAHQASLDAAVPHGRHYYWKSHKLGPLTDDVIATMGEHLGRITSPLSTVPLFCFGGAVARVDEESTAFPYRDATHDINIVASWLPEQAAEADRHMAWVRDFFDDLAPHSRGVYVNFTSDDADERVRSAYSATQWTRLTALKAKYDPTNFFNRNANIPPS